MKEKIKLFLLITLLCYVLYNCIDLTGCFPYEVGLRVKYISIIVCFFYVMSQVILDHAVSPMFIGVLFFVVISDYFLLFTDQFCYGLLSFLMVQFFIFLLIQLKSNNFNRIFMYRSIILVVCLEVILLIMVKVTLEEVSLLVLSAIYFTFFTLNMILASLNYRRDRGKKQFLFLAGLSLYYLCDLNVGLFHLSDYSGVPRLLTPLIEFSAIGMWLFYLPGIVCISLCADSSFQD